MRAWDVGRKKIDRRKSRKSPPPNHDALLATLVDDGRHRETVKNILCNTKNDVRSLISKTCMPACCVSLSLCS